MTQYIRPAIAVPAVAASVAQAQGTEDKDQRSLHRRLAALFGAMPGTTQYGTMRVLNSTEYDLAVPDAVYNAATALGLDTSDFRYNSATARGSYGNTSVIPYLRNDGLRPQIILAAGDSRCNSAIGGVSPNAQDQMWAQGITRNGLATFFSPTTTTEKFAYNYRWSHGKSRLIWNFGRDSGRLVNISGWTYTIGFNWLDNIEQMVDMVVGPRQQLVIAIHDTNDIPYGSTNGNPGLAAVPIGTPGATYTGAINYIDSCLKPFIAALKTRYAAVADLVFVHCGMYARGAGVGTTDPVLCAKNVEVMNYLKANKAGVGIKFGIDTTQIAALSPTIPANVLNPTIFQNDTVHLMTAGNQEMDGPKGALFDRCLGYAPDPTYAGLIY